MTNNADAQVARQWAERFIKYADNAQIVDADELTAARYILATTAPPTMADVEWDDDVHAGLCAEHAKHGTVRMLSEWKGEIACLVDGHATLWLAPKYLTPLPGTRLDLTPRREPVPESTPDHPEFLETEEDYQNAPERTIVVAFSNHPWMKVGGFWGRNGVKYDAAELCGVPREVLRWGWEA